MIRFELIFACVMNGLNSFFPCEYLTVPAPFVKKMACIVVASAFTSFTFVSLKKGEVGRAQRIDV